MNTLNNAFNLPTGTPTEKNFALSLHLEEKLDNHVKRIKNKEQKLWTFFS